MSLPTLLSSAIRNPQIKVLRYPASLLSVFAVSTALNGPLNSYFANVSTVFSILFGITGLYTALKIKSEQDASGRSSDRKASAVRGDGDSPDASDSRNEPGTGVPTAMPANASTGSIGTADRPSVDGSSLFLMIARITFVFLFSYMTIQFITDNLSDYAFALAQQGGMAGEAVDLLTLYLSGMLFGAVWLPFLAMIAYSAGRTTPQARLIHLLTPVLIGRAFIWCWLQLMGSRYVSTTDYLNGILQFSGPLDAYRPVIILITQIIAWLLTTLLFALWILLFHFIGRKVDERRLSRTAEAAVL